MKPHRRGPGILKSTFIITGLVIASVAIVALLLNFRLKARLESCRLNTAYPGARVVEAEEPGLWRVRGQFRMVQVTNDDVETVQDWYHRAQARVRREAADAGDNVIDIWAGALEIVADSETGGSRITSLCPGA